MKKLLFLLLAVLLLTSCKKEEAKENFEEFNTYFNIPTNWGYKTDGYFGRNYTNLDDFINIGEVDNLEEFEERIQENFNFWAPKRFRLLNDWKFEYDTDGGGAITDFWIETGKEDEHKRIRGKIILLEDGTYQYCAVTTQKEEDMDELVKNVFR